MSDQAKKTVSGSSIDGHLYEIYPNDLNPNNTVFGGRIMEIADMLAAACAKIHTEKTCATLMVDSMRFLSPAYRGEILIFKASINRTWRTSLEVGIQVGAIGAGSSNPRKVLSAFFTFVALDDSNKPSEVPEISPETSEQKRRYQEADTRRKHRIEQAKIKEQERKSNPNSE